MPRQTFTFDSDNEGWRVYDQSSGFFIGNTLYNSFFGGAQIADNETGTSPWFATPSSFSGDNSVLIGGTVNFEYRNADAQPGVDAPISSIDVTLVANDGTQVFASIPITSTTSTIVQNVAFNLDAATFGVSEAQFEAIMSDLSFFGISSDARTTQENSIIDNVVFDAPADGTVDGEDIGEVMDVGYNDETGDTDGGGDIITSGADNIEGNGGDDTITAGGGDDTVDGGTGADSIQGKGGADFIYGASGNDTIDGGSANDTVIGGAGNDSLLGGINGDVLGRSSNLLENGDFSAGATGWTVNNPTGGGAPDLTVGAANFNGGNESSYGDSIEQDFASIIGATHTVNLDLNEAFGGVGDHTFRIDVLDDDGNVITTETHTVTDGSTINVSFDFVATSNSSTLVITNTNATNTNGSDGRVDNVEVFVSDDPGDDTMDGGSGDDEIFGGSGNDDLTGGSSNDTLDGGADDDTLTGGADNDTMTGGAGDDVFVLSDGSGADLITDFDLADDDSDGSTNDRFDVSGLTDTDGNPVNAWDVTVTDDGSGNALLTFPNGEQVVLQGVAPTEIDDTSELVAAGIPCFTPGTLIRTPRGDIPVERLVPGDLVNTLDHGPQPVRWVASTTLDQNALAKNPHLRPIRIPAGVLNVHKPLLVSPQHAMLVASGRAQHLVRAKHLARTRGPVRVAHGQRSVRYVHLMLDRHQMLCANNAWSESFYPGPQALKMLPWRERLKLVALVPGLLTKPVETAYGPRARPLVTASAIKDIDLLCAVVPNATPVAS